MKKMQMIAHFRSGAIVKGQVAPMVPEAEELFLDESPNRREFREMLAGHIKGEPSHMELQTDDGIIIFASDAVEFMELNTWEDPTS